MIPFSLARRVGRERSQESPKKKHDAISKRKRVIPPSYDCPVVLSTDAGGKYQKAGWTFQKIQIREGVSVMVARCRNTLSCSASRHKNPSLRTHLAGHLESLWTPLRPIPLDQQRGARVVVHFQRLHIRRRVCVLFIEDYRGEGNIRAKTILSGRNHFKIVILCMLRVF